MTNTNLSENKFNSLASTTSDAIITADKNGKIESWNNAAEIIFGYSQNETIGEQFEIIFPEKYRKGLERIRLGGGKDSINRAILKGQKKDGSIFPIELTISKFQSQEEIKINGVIKDITKRKLQEEQLKFSEIKFKSITSTAKDAIISANEEGIIESWNLAAETIFGYSEEEAVGQKNEIIFPEAFRKEHRVGMERIKNGKETDYSGRTIEVNGKRKDGSEFPIELSISIFEGQNGLKTSGIIRDITQRKRREEELIFSENKFRTITSTATDAIIFTDKNGVIEFWNNAAEAIFGYTQEQAIGKKTDVFIPKNLLSFSDDPKDQLGIGKVIELEGFHKDGTIIPIELSLTPFEGRDGKKYSGTIRDITERKKAEAIILNANKRMEGELNVANDIQQSMLPSELPEQEEIDIFATLIPAREVGGDLYDYFLLDNNHICFVVGDVSDKGVPAALMMAVTKALLKFKAQNETSTAHIITEVNNQIAQDNKMYMFISIFMAILNTDTGEMIYTNAGHDPSFVVKKNKDVLKLSDLHGPIVGAVENRIYTESKITLEKDDYIVAYTDGVTEAKNNNDEFFSREALVSLLKNDNYNSAKDLIHLIVNKTKAFANGAKQFDDITLLALKYLKSKELKEEKTLEIEVPNKIKEIHTVLSKLETFGAINKFRTEVLMKTNIVIDELLNNIISYGYENNDTHFIKISFEVKDNKLITKITDDGISFNPFDFTPPSNNTPLEERVTGKLGIRLVKSLVDEYNYNRTDNNNNVITLIKNNPN
ncbi:PAS domain S-box protein [Flavobacteriaceae bacterium]|nr:PAS domain S-box protein [Flavobacteriaceae bacterium]